MSWRLVEKIITLPVSLIVGILVARYLGPADLGILSYCTSVIVFFSAIRGLGMQGVINRDLIAHPERRNEIIGTSVVFLFLGALVAYVLSIVTICLLRPAQPLYILLVSILGLGFFFRINDPIRAFYSAQVKSKFIVLSGLIGFGLSNLLKVYLVYAKSQLIFFSITIVIDTAVASIMMFFYLKHFDMSIAQFTYRFGEGMRILKESYPLILSGTVVLLYMKIDQVMIGQMLSESDVGNYSVGVRLAEIWIFIPGIVQSSTFTSIIKSKKNSNEEYLRKLQSLFKTVIFISYCIIVPLFFFAEPLVKLLYGPDYADAGSVLLILLGTIPFASLGIARASYIYGNNLIKLHSLISVIGLVINVFLNYYFIQFWGIRGAAYASLITNIYVGLLCCFIHKPLFELVKLKLSALLKPFPRLKDLA